METLADWAREASGQKRLSHSGISAGGASETLVR